MTLKQTSKIVTEYKYIVIEFKKQLGIKGHITKIEYDPNGIGGGNQPFIITTEVDQ